MENSIDKTDLNSWLSDLDNVYQLKALRSIIASTRNRDVIWNDLSQDAQENLYTDDEVEKNDLQFSPKKFWNLVWSLKESSTPGDWWDEISEAEKAGILRGIADLEAGRTTPHEEVVKKYEHWLEEKPNK